VKYLHSYSKYAYGMTTSFQRNVSGKNFLMSTSSPSSDSSSENDFRSLPEAAAEYDVETLDESTERVSS